MSRSIFSKPDSGVFDFEGSVFNDRDFEKFFSDFAGGSAYVTRYNGFDSFYLDDFANSVVNHHYFSKFDEIASASKSAVGYLSRLDFGAQAKTFTDLSFERTNAIEAVTMSLTAQSPGTALDERDVKDRSELVSHRFMEAGRSFAYAFEVKFDFDGKRGSEANWLNIVQMKVANSGAVQADEIPFRLAVYTNERGYSYLSVRVDGEDIGRNFFINGYHTYSVKILINQAETNARGDSSALRVEVIDRTAQSKALEIAAQGGDAPAASTYLHHWDLADASNPPLMGEFDENGRAYDNYIRIGTYRDGVDTDGRAVTQNISATFTKFEALAASDHALGGTRTDGTAGNDVLGNNSGTDFRDVDIIYAGAGDDRLYGGFADDLLYGQDGLDRLFGGQGNDDLYGGEGRDRLYGGTGSDRLFGESGSDLIYGGRGADLISGGFGHDRLFGDDGDDILRGDKGTDYLSGGAGDDRLLGGRDADIFYFTRGDGFDRISDFDASEGDMLHLGISRSEFENRVQFFGDDMRLNLGDGQKLFIYGVDADDLAGSVVFDM